MNICVDWVTDMVFINLEYMDADYAIDTGCPKSRQVYIFEAIFSTPLQVIYHGDKFS